MSPGIRLTVSSSAWIFSYHLALRTIATAITFWSIPRTYSYRTTLPFAWHYCSHLAFLIIFYKIKSISYRHTLSGCNHVIYIGCYFLYVDTYNKAQYHHFYRKNINLACITYPSASTRSEKYRFTIGCGQ